MKNSFLSTFFFAGITGVAACGGPLDGATLNGADIGQEELAESEDALCKSLFNCGGVGRTVTPRPDLIPEIVAGAFNSFACPVGNGDTVNVRVRNQGNANAGSFVVRTEVTLYTGSQFYTYKRHFLVGGLVAGAQTTVGVNLGDGVNAAPGSDGLTVPQATIQFFNGVTSNWSSGTYVVSWKVTVDTSMGVTWFPTGSTFQEIAYADNAIVEGNEGNNIIEGTRAACGFPSGLVLSQ